MMKMQIEDGSKGRVSRTECPIRQRETCWSEEVNGGAGRAVSGQGSGLGKRWCGLAQDGIRDAPMKGSDWKYILKVELVGFES